MNINDSTTAPASTVAAASRVAAWNPQRPSGMPYDRYCDVFTRVEVPEIERRWPSNRLTAAPLWVPVDLRDGNQALADPMGPERKRRFFDMMVGLGYKEIEVGYPSASQTDFDFVRELAEPGRVPDDVAIVVFTPARADLIDRTFAAIEGMANVVVHMYTATAPIWRDVVLRTGRDELREMVRAAGEHVARCAGERRGVRFEFSPEVFNLTEPDFALEVCDTMTALWQASSDRPVIINLPATVEVATPNIYADQIEYMDRNLARREHVILSVHPHNDRGTGIACAELAMLAGAQRVEGCLFGNGERTGNVDLATLALNLYAQGIDPMIDFSDIDRVRATVEYCNQIPIHSRHPYVGEYVHTAFSGTHQDAINKGFVRHRHDAAAAGVAESRARWQVPYLPIDPKDIGRSYEAVIRINSQSGKGGIAYIMHTEHGLALPAGMQRAFGRIVQAHTDTTGVEAGADTLWKLFEATYLADPRHIALLDWDIEHHDGRERLTATISIDGQTTTATATTEGSVEAMVQILTSHGQPVGIVAYEQQSVGSGPAAQAATYVEYGIGDGTAWAVGMHRSVVESSLRAVIAAANALHDSRTT